MKRLLLLLIAVAFILNVDARPRRYRNGGSIRYQRSYYKKSTGKYVSGHYKTRPDRVKYNNLKGRRY